VGALLSSGRFFLHSRFQISNLKFEIEELIPPASNHKKRGRSCLVISWTVRSTGRNETKTGHYLTLNFCAGKQSQELIRAANSFDRGSSTTFSRGLRLSFTKLHIQLTHSLRR
jgi:hypothetical protein